MSTTVPVSQLAGDWHAHPGVLAAAALAAFLFGQGFVRLRRRGRADRAGWGRLVLFAAGLALAVLPLVSPLDVAGDRYLLSAHMLQHVLIGDAAALLLVLAVRGPLAFFLLPPPVLRPLAGSHRVRAFLHGVLRPGVTFVLWVVVMLGWHIPAAYDYALSHALVHDIEHSSFVLVGILLWTQLLDPGRREALTRGRRIAFAFGVLVMSHPIADVLIFTPTAVYHPYATQSQRLLGIGVLTDQRLAGVIMLVEQLLTLGTFIAVLLWPLLRSRTRRALALQGPA